MKFGKIGCISILIFWITSSIAHAHRVIVFAWVEDNTIHVQGSFGSNKKAKNCQVMLQNQDARILEKGTTDETGRVSFVLPHPIESDLIVILNAGQGHKGTWTLSKQEIQEAVKKIEPEIKAGEQPITEQAEKKMEELEKPPPLKKILLGIGLIFLLAFALKQMRPKKDVK